ncbi:group II intron-encoded protein LtrA, partial [human gut metagenome]
MDEGYKRVFYIRYADDFLIGVIGRKADAEQVKQDVGRFIRENLHLEMSEEKTLITHGHDFAKFLGYEVTIAKGECNKKTKTGATRRVNNGKVMLYVPHDKWVKRLLSYHALKIKHDKQNGNKEVWEPVRRTRLLHLDDLEILNQYNAEIRGLYNYYRLANNVSVLNNFYYVMRYSMLKTFAGKYRTRISRIIQKYHQGKDFVWSIRRKTARLERCCSITTGFAVIPKWKADNPDVIARVFENYD